MSVSASHAPIPTGHTPPRCTLVGHYDTRFIYCFCCIYSILYIIQIYASNSHWSDTAAVCTLVINIHIYYGTQLNYSVHLGTVVQCTSAGQLQSQLHSCTHSPMPYDAQNCVRYLCTAAHHTLLHCKHQPLWLPACTLNQEVQS